MTRLPLFSMISHGTDGSDGLEEGIHLRWQFDRRLGFPPFRNGFDLYRRRSCSRRISTHFGDISTNRITLPYEHIIRSKKREYRIRISSVTSETSGKDEISFDGIQSSKPVLLSDPPVKVSLPNDTYAVEIDATFSAGECQVTSMIDGTEIDTRSFSGSGRKSIGLSTVGANSVIIKRDGVDISNIFFDVCQDCGNPWGSPINLDCGTSLPTNWEQAKCRLPQEKWADFEKPFEDLKELLKLPMNWKISYKDESTATSTEETSPEFQISPLDMLLMSSIDPYIARILGLYWVDQKAIDGELYDYKIVGNWETGEIKPSWWNLENIVDFEKEKIGKKFFNVFKKESFVFATDGPSTVEYDASSEFAQAKRGLHIMHPAIIIFTEPVRELQLFVSQQQRSVTLTGFSNGKRVSYSSLSYQRILTARYRENIDYVVLDANDIMIYKICWDAEYIPNEKHSYTICGVKKGRPEALGVPTGLRAFSLPGITKTLQDGSILDNRLVIGLTWDIPKNIEGRLRGTNPAVLYHVEHKSLGGNVEWLTENSPVKVVPGTFDDPPSWPKDDPPSWPKGWPQQRLFYTHVQSPKSEHTTGEYRICAVDIFGRMSKFTEWVSAGEITTRPPPPSDIEAKLLDRSDPSLTGDEKAWVTASGRTGLKVRWNWTESLEEQAPDVSAFKIYFQPGWLNVVQGKIEADPIEDTYGLMLPTSYISSIVPTVPPNVFRAEKLLMNMNSYIIVSSDRDKTTGKFIFRILKPIPSTNDYCSAEFGTFLITHVDDIRDRKYLEITTDYKVPSQANLESLVGQFLTIRQKFRAGQYLTIIQQRYNILSCRRATDNNALFTIPKIYPRANDFFSIPISIQKEPPDGTFIDYRNPSSWQQMLHTQPRALSTRQYEIIIPDPPLVADRTNKVTYAQIGISSVNAGGAGSVSSPAPIIAVFREPPPPEDLEDPTNTYSSIPNYYGKSSYALRWRKSGTDVRYFVYRAMDETLFSIDKEIRATSSRDPANYSQFLNKFNAAHRNEIIDKVIKPPSIDYGALTRDPLKNTLLKALASLAGNEKAFAKLHEQSIHPDDPTFANRNTEASAPGAEEPVVDPTLLLYYDESIDGRANNIYFYRIRTVNEVGTLGSFGLSTPPIYLPQTILPKRPTITKIQSGDRRITIKWSANYDRNLSGFLIYRTDNERLANDVRRMHILKGGNDDVLTVRISNLSTTEFTYVDDGTDTRRRYYYRITARDSNGMMSNPSDIVACEAIEIAPPSPPAWIELTRSHDKTSTDLRWKSLDSLQCIVKRRRLGSVAAIPVSDWLSPESFDESTKNWQYSWIDKDLDPSAVYSYYILGRNTVGVQVESSEEVSII